MGVIVNYITKSVNAGIRWRDHINLGRASAAKVR